MPNGPQEVGSEAFDELYQAGKVRFWCFKPKSRSDRVTKKIL